MDTLLFALLKYFKSLSDKPLLHESKLEFISCIFSIKTKFLLVVKAMHFVIQMV